MNLIFNIACLACFGIIAFVLIEVVFWPFLRGFLNGIRSKKN